MTWANYFQPSALFDESMLHVNRMENTTSQNLKPALFVSFGNKQICHHLRWRISCVYPGMFTAIFPLMEWESLHHLSIVSSHASWNLNWFPHSPPAKYTFVRTRWFSNWHWLQWWLLLLSCLILLDHGNLMPSRWCAFETPQNSHKILSWVPGTQGFSFAHRLSPVAHTLMTRPVDLAELQGPGPRLP